VRRDTAKALDEEEFMRAVIAALLVLVVSHAVAQTDTRVALGVLDLDSGTIPEAELRVLSDRLRVELFNTGQFRIIERERIDAVLREQGFQLSGCTATSCVVEIGELVGVRKMVAGSVGKVGDVYSLTLRIIDVESGAIERTAVQDCRCSLQTLLTSTIALAAAELAGVAPTVTQTLERGEGYGVLYVNSIPPGAVIYLNGTLRRERTPATIDRLPAGEHIVRAVLDSLVGEQRVRVTRDAVTKTTLSLQPGTGSLFITSEPPEASVTLDGRPAGTTPLLLPQVTVGARTVVFSHADFFPDSQRVTVRFNERTPVSARLVPCGYLDIQVTPATARVYLDSRELGRDQMRLRLPLGQYRLTMVAADYDTVRRAVTIGHGQTVVVRETLTSVFGGVRITSNPEGASVSCPAAGIRGFTPFESDRLLPGSYRVRVEKAGRLPGEVNVAVIKGRTVSIHVNLAEDPDIVRMRNERIKVRARWTTLVVGLAAAGFGAKWGFDANHAYDDRETAYTNYLSATTTATATQWRTAYENADRRGDRAAKKRNVSLGAAGALLGVSIVLTVR